MSTLNLLYKKEYSVNDYIHVVIPTVGQVVDNEDLYYTMVTAFTAMPIDLMVQLDDLGIDFEDLTDYDLFLLNKEDGLVIDRALYNQISAVLRKIHHIEKNRRKPGNKEAKEYMLSRAREKQKRNKNRKKDSQTESLIMAMVNSPEFKYNFETVRDLSIYQFNESVRQIINRVDYNNRMYGIYSGTLNVKDLSQDDLNWLTHK